MTRISMAVAGCLLAAFLVCVPLALPQMGRWWAYDMARVLELALALVSSLAVAARLLSPEFSLGFYRRVRLALLLFAALGCVSAAMAGSPEHAFRELALLAGLGSVSAVVAAATRRERWPRWLLVVLISVAGYAAVILMVALLQLAATGGVDAYTVLLGHDNPRAFNHVQTLALPLAAAGLLSTRRWTRRLAWIALVTSGALLWGSAGRGTLMGLLVAMLCLLVLGKRQARGIALRLFCALSVAALLGSLMFQMLPRSDEGTSAASQAHALSRLGSDQSRLLLWKEAAQAALQSPWFGLGPGHLAQGAHAKAAHPHNLYLQLAAEHGLPATLLLLGLLAAFLRRLALAVSATNDGEEQSGVGYCLLATWAALLTDSFVSGLWVMPISQVWIALLCGWSWGWLAAQEKTVRSELSSAESRLRPAMAALLLSSQVMLWVSIGPELRDLPAHLSRMEEAFPSDRTHPRFWSHGHF